MNIDAEQLPELTKRQEEILSIIVRTYTQNPEPVSSKHIVETHNLGVSSATVRNEMAVLDELGYIKAPHTSSGRVPSERGYRYFVSRVIDNSDLSDSEQRHITERFQKMPMGTEQWMRFAAKILARTAQTASLVTPPIIESSRFKHVELVAIQGRLVLMVLVLHGGMVQQRMLNLAEPVPQTKLAETADRINASFVDLYPQQIRLKSVQLSLLEREISELIVEIMDSVNSHPVRAIYREGLSEIISNFPDEEGAQQAIRVFEESAFLDLILTELIDPIMSDVRVVVAGDGHDELSQLSMVLGRYGVPGKMSGAVGVVGPMHINYGRAISSVRYVSTTMTNMLVQLYNDQDETQ
jgi:heat-inducible transcriptional repressor